MNDSAAVGVDEAGKGPVLGPMVAAAVRAPPPALPDGVADSKRLSAARRESLAATLRERDAVAVGVAVVPVAAIDDLATDMNTLTIRGQAAAVAAVAGDGDRVVADAGDTSESRFARRLTDRIGRGDADTGADADTEFAVEPVADSPAGVEVVAEHGADDAYDAVAAASVVAKVERDRRLAAIGAAYDRPLGSGYPSDPTTRTFLRDHVAETGELPDCARASWATAEDVLAAAEQSALEEF
ncbi:MAG: ribonuclease HII [Halolamina sp.]